MKSKISLLALLLALIAGPAFAQLQPDLQYFRPNDKRGLNVFETSKSDLEGYDGLKVRVGGDFALQFQALDQENDAKSLAKLGSDFNLPTANLNLDAQLYDGVRLHLRTYLSSRHHSEAWVKGGHLQIDKLDFIKEDFLKGIMDVATIRVGLDEFGYGDLVYRRSDNARTIFNPFVGNYIMDPFSTEAFGEVIIQKNWFVGMLGLTNGKLNQTVKVTSASDNKPSIYGKLGFDQQINPDLRLRLTGSIYANGGETTGQWLYAGDRTGSRYYLAMHTESGEGTNFDPRINPALRKMTAIQINPFVKYKGLEFFGVYETVSGTSVPALSNSSLGDGQYDQLGLELLYRFGKNENLYIGGRYNSVTGKSTEQASATDSDRFNIGGGWFMTRNILAKVEYMNQNFTGAGWSGTRFEGGSLNGIVIEAVIGF